MDDLREDELEGLDGLDELDGPVAVGVVPVEGRGSWPFALLHGESLVAAASWALGEAGVELLDFTQSWADVVEREVALVLHDPLCPATPVGFLRQAVATCVRQGVVVAGARPVTDTVRSADPAGRLGESVGRDELRAVCSPVVLPAAVVATLPDWPTEVELGDPTALVARLAADHEVRLLEAPAAARRVVDESDLRLLEALASR